MFLLRCGRASCVFVVIVPVIEDLGFAGLLLAPVELHHVPLVVQLAHARVLIGAWLLFAAGLRVAVGGFRVLVALQLVLLLLQ